MNFEENIKRLQAAQGDPEQLALITTDIVLEQHPAALRAAFEAAAVPHWFDTPILAELMEISEAAAEELLIGLQKLPMVESFALRKGWNVHEATRLALRNRLAREELERFQALSRRASQYFAGDEPAWHVEVLYHRLSGSAEGAAEELEASWKSWNNAGRHEPLQALGVALGELVQTDYLVPTVRARVLLRFGSIRGARLPLRIREGLTSEALIIFQSLADAPGELDSHDQLGGVFVSEGRLGSGLEEYRAQRRIVEKLVERDPENTDWQRELSVSHNKLGRVLHAQGQLAGALAEYQRFKEITEQLTEHNPENTDWQRGLSVAHNSVGSVLQAQGQLAGALAEYQKSKEIRGRLTERDPENTNWQRDLSVSYNHVGNVLQAQGQLAGALAEYQKSKGIRERLTGRDPENVDWQRDLSVSHNNVGSVLQAQGQLAGALAEYQKSKEIRGLLTERDPENTNWQRDLSVSHNNVGNVLQAQGQLAGALAEYQKSKEIRRRLTERDPENSDWQRDLAESHNLIGAALEVQSNWLRALHEYGTSLEIAKRLAALDPTNVQWQKDLAVAQEIFHQLKTKLAENEEEDK